MDIVAILNAERRMLQAQLEAVKRGLKAFAGVSGTKRRLRRPISAAGRKRIIQAQRARWAKWRKEHKGR
jgi:hypothetical protein